VQINFTLSCDIYFTNRPLAWFTNTKPDCT